MSKPLFTEEETTELVKKYAVSYNLQGDGGSYKTQAEVDAFLAGIAAAKAEFQRRLEEAPVVYGNEVGGWTSSIYQPGLLYTHKAKLMNSEPIELIKEEPSDDQS